MIKSLKPYRISSSQVLVPEVSRVSHYWRAAGRRYIRFRSSSVTRNGQHLMCTRFAYIVIAYANYCFDDRVKKGCNAIDCGLVVRQMFKLPDDINRTRVRTFALRDKGLLTSFAALSTTMFVPKYHSFVLVLYIRVMHVRSLI